MRERRPALALRAEEEPLSALSVKSPSGGFAPRGPVRPAAPEAAIEHGPSPPGHSFADTVPVRPSAYSNTLQRFADYKAVDWKAAQSARFLKPIVVVKVEDNSPDALVVKHGKEPAWEQEASELLHEAVSGAEAVRVRLVGAEEQPLLSAALGRCLPDDRHKQPFLDTFGNDNIYVMPFFEGADFDEADEAVQQALITDPAFMRRLGSIDAVDLFLGHLDRVVPFNSIAKLMNVLVDGERNIRLIDNYDRTPREGMPQKFDFPELNHERAVKALETGAISRHANRVVPMLLVRYAPGFEAQDDLIASYEAGMRESAALIAEKILAPQQELEHSHDEPEKVANLVRRADLLDELTYIEQVRGWVKNPVWDREGKAPATRRKCPDGIASMRALFEQPGEIVRRDDLSKIRLIAEERYGNGDRPTFRSERTHEFYRDMKGLP